MPTITDWLMVGITVVYVIATIFICVANIHSAKASQLQLLEMKREYEENQRITLMPYFNNCKCVEAVGEQGEAACWLTKPCTKDYLDATVFFQLTNCGPGNAVDISYEWKGVEYSDRDVSYVASLSAGGARNLKVKFYTRKPDCAKRDTAFIDITFWDLFGNQYLQEVCINFIIDSDSLTIRNNIPISRPKLQQSSD